MHKAGSRENPLAFFLLLTVLGLTLGSLPGRTFAENPSCGDTITTNTTLSANIGPCAGNGLVIGASNITLDCAGFALDGTSASNVHVEYAGVNITEQSGVTVENCAVTGFTEGILIANSSFGIFTGDAAYDNGNEGQGVGYGYYILGSSSNTLTGDSASSDGYSGFQLDGSTNNNLTSTLSNENGFYGYYVLNSYNNTLSKSVADLNAYIGFRLGSDDTNDTFSGNQADSEQNGFFGGIYNSTFVGNMADSDVDGFSLGSLFSSTFVDNTANNNGYNGFLILDSSNNSFTENTADSNGNYGFILGTSQGHVCNNNTLTANTANGNSYAGFYLFGSSNNNTLSGNTANGNDNGIVVFGSNNTLTANILTGNTLGEMTVNGFTIPSDWGSVRVVSQSDSSQPPGTGPVNVTSATFYDVQLVGIVGGTAEICIAGVPSQANEIQYWNGTSWVKAADQTAIGTTLCGDIPVADLSGTPIVIGASGTVAVSCSPDSVVVGSAATCTAKITGSSPTGKITWSSNGSGKFSRTSCTLSVGACSVKYTPTSAVSPVTITAKYAGDKYNLPSSGANTLTVTKKSSKVTMTCNPTSVVAGSSTVITCKITVTGYSPTGNVTWSQRGTGKVTFTSISCTLSKGSCSVTLVGTTAGTVTIKASYGGDSNNVGSSHTRKITVLSH